jgi:phosphoglycolate phosphatase
MSIKPLKLIVFDWDGTLADSTKMITRALIQSCADLGLPTPTERQASYVIGLGLRDSLMAVAPSLSEDRYPEMVAAFRKRFIDGESGIALFDGARAMLDDLNAQGALLGVATGKSRAGLNRAIDTLGLHQVFSATRCADEGHPKPHPEMLLHVIQSCGAEASNVMMVGDTTHDLQLAQNAGVASIAVSYGAHDFSAYDTFAVSHSIFELHQQLSRWLNQ